MRASLLDRDRVVSYPHFTSKGSLLVDASRPRRACKKGRSRAELSSPAERCIVSSSGWAILMEDSVERLDALIRSGARRLTGYQRRLFLAEVATELCGGSARQAERRFGWGRDTVETGLHELRHGVRCLENFAARGRQRCEQKDPQLAADIHAIVEPHTHADPELKSSRRYTNLSAAEVRQALIDQGYPRQGLPSERTMRDILNRMNYRLKRIRKGQPLKETDQTDAIFANVAAVREQARDQPETLEISMDTKAKVGLGDYYYFVTNLGGSGSLYSLRQMSILQSPSSFWIAFSDNRRRRSHSERPMDVSLSCNRACDN